MIEFRQIKIHHRDMDLSSEREILRKTVSEKLHINQDSMSRFEITKRSIDARNKPDIIYVYAVRFQSETEENILKKNHKNKNLKSVKKPVLYEARLKHLSGVSEQIVIVGSGPAGLFAAYSLSLRGLRPVLIERGGKMEERIGEVENFWKSGILNEECNVCFGEGGAGTFSDGKLNSGVKDRDGSKRFILETFVRFGAGRDILYDAKPHIGTDVLRSVIVNMRAAMERAGCTFFFHTKMTGLMQKEGRITGIIVEQETDGSYAGSADSPFEELAHEDVLLCDRLILAIGHSARDTFELLKKNDILMRPKAFAVGVRVQHRQADIDRVQYGEQPPEGPQVPAAYYKLTGRTEDGRGVYSFCMCPGGYVINASSETGCLVVNGMSDAARDSGYANAAIVVTVDPEQQDEDASGDVLLGVAYQRRLERAMYKLARGKIPVQRYGEFRRLIKNDASGTDALQDKEEPGPVKQSVTLGKLSSNQPAVMGQWTYADLNSALPKDMAGAIVEAIDQFGKKIRDFDAEDTLILGMESRTSSPVRIVRDEQSFESESLKGLYPCGEGAGYAGGILSAAMDGLRVAERVAETLQGEAEK